jgi:segregation and condensation protein A
MSKTLKHLQTNKQTTLFDLINMNEIDFSTSTLVVYFLAILELVKEGLILFKQSQAFAPIYLDISYEAS